MSRYIYLNLSCRSQSYGCWEFPRPEAAHEPAKIASRVDLQSTWRSLQDETSGMARHLQDILNGPAKFTDPEPWLELLNRGDVKKPTQSQTRSQPRFFGIETEGERFCYVLDMSDSMLKEIAPGARPKGPITGPRKKKSKKRRGSSDSRSDDRSRSSSHRRKRKVRISNHARA